MHTVLQGGIFMSHTKKWQVEEVFHFPIELGCVKEGKKINVQVNWETKQLSDVVSIHGIYHITARVLFGAEGQFQSDVGTLIEHVDLEGDEGYFEYAVPFSLDLPNVELKDLRVEDVKTNCENVLHIAWQVVCVYDEITTTTDDLHRERYLEVPKADVQLAQVKETIVEEIKEQPKVEAIVQQPVQPIVEPKEKVEITLLDNVGVKVDVSEKIKQEPVREIIEQILEEESIETPVDESSYESPSKFMNESINRILREKTDESTEFIFHLEESYRKQSVPLNKIRHE